MMEGTSKNTHRILMELDRHSPHLRYVRIDSQVANDSFEDVSNIGNLIDSAVKEYEDWCESEDASKLVAYLSDYCKRNLLPKRLDRCTKDNQSIEVLDLTGIPGERIPNVVPNIDFSKVRRLYLAGVVNNESAESHGWLVRIYEALSKTQLDHLEFLSLGDNSLGYSLQGFETFSELTLKLLSKFTSLVTLVLSDNNITDSESKFIAQLFEQSQTLCHIDLSGNKISSSVFVAALQPRQHQNPMQINFTGNAKFNDEELEELKNKKFEALKIQSPEDVNQQKKLLLEKRAVVLYSD